MNRFPKPFALLLAAFGVAISSCSTAHDQIDDVLLEYAQAQPLSLDHHALPGTLRWIQCLGGKNEGLMRAIGPTGSSMGLSAGHRLEIRNGTVADSTDFVFFEPHSHHIVVNATSSVKTVAPGGFRLTVRWGQRPGCNVPPTAALYRVVPGGVAELVGEGKTLRDGYIEATVDSLSTFAIAG